MAIHENLRNLRLAANMTQEQAAEQIGITRQGLSSYETGRTLPDIEMLKRLAELYDTDLESLIYGKAQKARAYHMIKVLAVTLYIALAALTLISSAIMRICNYFFAISDGQMLTDAVKRVFEIRTRLLSIRQFADSLILAITFLGALILLIICASGRSRYRIKDRLVSVAVCSGTILLIAFLFGISDHIYTISDYLITPLLVTARLCIFLLLDMLIEKVQKRKRTGDRC